MPSLAAGYAGQAGSMEALRLLLQLTYGKDMYLHLDQPAHLLAAHLCSRVRWLAPQWP